jgi:hypothetical protein
MQVCNAFSEIAHRISCGSVACLKNAGWEGSVESSRNERFFGLPV